jgi:hypothetical protein
MSNDPANPNPYRSRDVAPVDNRLAYPVYQRPPAVILWQLIYCGVMVFVYLGIAGIGVFLFVNADQLADPEMRPPELKVLGGMFFFLGVLLSALFSAGFIWRRGMSGWVLHIVLIAIGLTSVCCWPTNIPLLIFWIKHRDYIVNSGNG